MPQLHEDGNRKVKAYRRRRSTCLSIGNSDLYRSARLVARVAGIRIIEKYLAILDTGMGSTFRKNFGIVAILSDSAPILLAVHTHVEH